MAAFTCWVGMLTFDLCCRGPWGVGMPSCWDGPFNWENCCLPDIRKQNISRKQFEAHLTQVERRDEEGPDSAPQHAPPDGPPTGAHDAHSAFESLASPDGPEWLRNMATCLSQYDAPESRRWFLAHSGIPAHFVSHVGNPAACMDGAHKFYWGLIVVGINLAGHQYQQTTMADVALEFSICVPRVCEYAVVDAVLVPFYLGPYLGKPWGPNPEFLYRFKHLGNGVADPGANTLQASAGAWMSEILMRGGQYHREFYEKEWPFRRELWEYQQTWWPSPTNEAVLAFLLIPIIVAGLIMFLVSCCSSESPSARDFPAPPRQQSIDGNGSAVSPSDEKAPAASAGRSAKGKTAHGRMGTAVFFVVKSFAPQTYINELSAPVENDLVGMHVLRILLQVVVCWQHAILFVEWLGTAGHHGIVNFLPLTNDIARSLGRVNTTFACLTVHLSCQSAIRTLQSADRRAAGIKSSRNGASSHLSATDAASPSNKTNGHKPQRHASSAAETHSVTADQAASNGKPSNGTGTVSSPNPSALRSVVVLWLWTVRRWIRQVGELGLWTFYFNQITQDIPWKPFPDFVQVWYRDRAESCRRWLAPGQMQLPMWLLSLFFVYEPVNSVLRIHRPPVSLCHNMQVFENLFTLSVCGAVLGAARHCFGGRTFVTLAVFAAAFAIRWEQSASTFVEEEVGWDEVIYSALQMLPASLGTAVLLSEVWPEERGLQRQPRHWPYMTVIGIGFALDFIKWGHAGLIGDYIPNLPLRSIVKSSLASILKSIEYAPTSAYMLCEGFHSVGIALLIRSFRPEASLGAFPWWARCISRLSLSVNLTNIFAIHYIRGRMLDHPVEFSHIHGLMYSLFAWLAALVASLVAYCMVAPYVTAAEAALSWLGRKILPSKAPPSK